MTLTFLLRASRYWLLAGAILLSLYLPLLYRDWLALKKEAIHDIEWHTSSLAQLLSHDLGQYRSLDQVLSHLDRPSTRRQFDEHVHQKLGHLGLLRIKIYRRDGRQLYNSDGGPLQPEMPDADFHRVLNGDAVTCILDQDAYAHIRQQRRPAHRRDLLSHPGGQSARTRFRAGGLL